MCQRHCRTSANGNRNWTEMWDRKKLYFTKICKTWYNSTSQFSNSYNTPILYTVWYGPYIINHVPFYPQNVIIFEVLNYGIPLSPYNLVIFGQFFNHRVDCKNLTWSLANWLPYIAVNINIIVIPNEFPGSYRIFNSALGPKCNCYFSIARIFLFFLSINFVC